jgi:hypothetical protein
MFPFGCMPRLVRLPAFLRVPKEFHFTAGALHAAAVFNNCLETRGGAQMRWLSGVFGATKPVL